MSRTSKSSSRKSQRRFAQPNIIKKVQALSSKLQNNCENILKDVFHEDYEIIIPDLLKDVKKFNNLGKLDTRVSIVKEPSKIVKMILSMWEKRKKKIEKDIRSSAKIAPMSRVSRKRRPLKALHRVRVPSNSKSRSSRNNKDYEVVPGLEKELELRKCLSDEKMNLESELKFLDTNYQEYLKKVCKVGRILYGILNILYKERKYKISSPDTVNAINSLRNNLKKYFEEYEDDSRKYRNNIHYKFARKHRATMGRIQNEIELCKLYDKHYASKRKSIRRSKAFRTINF